MSERTGNEQWREDAWRDQPGQSATARMRSAAADSARREELRLERRLTAALGRLPDAPISSNFTSRVLQAASLEEAVAGRRPARKRFLRWLPRLAFTCVLVTFGLFSWQRLELSRQAELVQSVEAISSASIPSPEILKDFEAIRALSRTPAADEQLLALMQ
jgi:hypothetical protein